MFINAILERSFLCKWKNWFWRSKTNSFQSRNSANQSQRIYLLTFTETEIGFLITRWPGKVPVLLLFTQQKKKQPVQLMTFKAQLLQSDMTQIYGGPEVQNTLKNTKCKNKLKITIEKAKQIKKTKHKKIIKCPRKQKLVPEIK